MQRVRRNVLTPFVATARRVVIVWVLHCFLLPPECPPRGVIRVCAGCQGGCARHTDSATFQVTVTPIRLHQRGVRVAFQPEDMLPDTRHLQTACTHTVCPAGACFPSASQAGLIRKLITPLKAHDI